MKFYRLLHLTALFCLIPVFASAQQPPQTKEDVEKHTLEYIDKEVQRLSTLLDLEYWQEFYVDSTLTHDLNALNEELMSMRVAKVENTDLYISVQDKWMEQIDKSYKRFFTPEQWAKYWKAGGKRAQQARDKRKK